MVPPEAFLLHSGAGPPILICLLGGFRLLVDDALVHLRHGGKIEGLLRMLALGEHRSASREALIEALWPECAPGRSSQTLNSLVHDTRRILSSTHAEPSPVIRTEDGYRLNPDAGVAIDTERFDTLTTAAGSRRREGDQSAATELYELAVGLYQGDLCSGGDLRTLIERERLRAEYLTALAFLSDTYFADGRYQSALEQAQRLLHADPCREDGHRVVMRCFARLGQRAQAMQQYKVCRYVLQQEFDAAPEQATEELFRHLRLQPDNV